MMRQYIFQGFNPLLGRLLNDSLADSSIMPQFEQYDVAVIGAGPAGGSAALHAAKLGLKTIILEEHNVIGEPVHCG
jgi:NADPH-dependent 2,4-dienoyl-CoA reductase/sulfur reductase-like enzyme